MVFVEIILFGQVDELLDVFEKVVCMIFDVLECYLMVGFVDYLLKVVVVDIDDFVCIYCMWLVKLFGVVQMYLLFLLKIVVQIIVLFI